MTLSEIYLKAAQVIAANGHSKGAYYSSPEAGVGIQPTPSESPVCAAGALAVAMYGSPVPPRGHEEMVTDEFEVAVSRLNARIEKFHLCGLAGEPPVMRLAGWNDDADRTAADVIGLFERTAREVA